MDIYSFNAKAGAVIQVGLDCDPWRDNTPFDARLELLDAVGTVLVKVDDSFLVTSSTETIPGTLDSPKPYSPGEGLIYRAVADGLFFVRVSSGESNTTASKWGDYLLSISTDCPICCLRQPVLGLLPGGTPGQWRLILDGAPLTRYQVHSTSDLREWPEADRFSCTTDATGHCETLLQASEEQLSRFYRAVQEP